MTTKDEAQRLGKVYLALEDERRRLHDDHFSVGWLDSGDELVLPEKVLDRQAMERFAELDAQIAAARSAFHDALRNMHT